MNNIRGELEFRSLEDCVGDRGSYKKANARGIKRKPAEGKHLKKQVSVV
jgi:hypothetical protein